MPFFASIYLSITNFNHHPIFRSNPWFTHPNPTLIPNPNHPDLLSMTSLPVLLLQLVSLAHANFTVKWLSLATSAPSQQKTRVKSQCISFWEGLVRLSYLWSTCSAHRHTVWMWYWREPQAVQCRSVLAETWWPQEGDWWTQAHLWRRQPSPGLDRKHAILFIWVSCFTFNSQPAHKWLPFLWVLTAVEACIQIGHTPQDSLPIWLRANENIIFVEHGLKCWWGSGRMVFHVDTAESNCVSCCNRKWRHLKDHWASWKTEETRESQSDLVSNCQYRD